MAEVCRHRLRDPHLAEDATQETFLRAWRALPNFSHDVDLTHWLRRIAANHCRDFWREAARGRFATQGGELLIEREDPRAEAEMTAAAERVAVRSILEQLRPRDAQLLIDHHGAGVSVRALARRWHLTKGAMEVALHRARQRARHCAERHGLQGIIPLGAYRRFTVWLQRSVADGAVSTSGAAAWGNLAVIALVAGIPQVAAPGPSVPPEAPPSQISSVATSVAGPGESSAGAVHQPARTRQSRPARGRSVAGDATAPRSRDDQAPDPVARDLIGLDPVTVPIGDQDVQSSPGEDWQQERRYTVSEPVTGREVFARATHQGRLTELRPVDRHACRATNAGHPIVDCHGGAGK